MVSKVCSRSQGHPPGPRSRAMIDTARSNRSPVVAITTNLHHTNLNQNTLCQGFLFCQSLGTPQILQLLFSTTCEWPQRCTETGDQPRTGADAADRAHYPICGIPEGSRKELPLT